MIPTYIVDLDGTIADCSHRLHLIKQEKPDWDAFHELCPQDKPIHDVIRIIQRLYDGAGDGYVVYLTGRMETNREATADWLVRNGLPVFNHAYLLMRKDGDFRKDEVIKPELLAEWMKDRSVRIAGCFEDRPAMCREWRKRGYTVFQLADVEF